MIVTAREHSVLHPAHVKDRDRHVSSEIHHQPHLAVTGASCPHRVSMIAPYNRRDQLYLFLFLYVPRILPYSPVESKTPSYDHARITAIALRLAFSSRASVNVSQGRHRANLQSSLLMTTAIPKTALFASTDYEPPSLASPTFFSALLSGRSYSCCALAPYSLLQKSLPTLAPPKRARI
jgi:hypothetical protein